MDYRKKILDILNARQQELEQKRVQLYENKAYFSDGYTIVLAKINQLIELRDIIGKL